MYQVSTPRWWSCRTLTQISPCTCYCRTIPTSLCQPWYPASTPTPSSMPCGASLTSPALLICPFRSSSWRRDMRQSWSRLVCAGFGLLWYCCASMSPSFQVNFEFMGVSKPWFFFFLSFLHLYFLIIWSCPLSPIITSTTILPVTFTPPLIASTDSASSILLIFTS